MARPAPRFEPGAYYHIYNRGAQRGIIFHRPVDYMRFLATVNFKLEGSGAVLVAYCLMPNHFHLLIQAGERSLSDVMQRLTGSYAMYYNRTYASNGHVFGQRYGVRKAASAGGVINLSRYIHHNPRELGDFRFYPWSSYGDYVGKGSGLSDPRPVLAMLGAGGAVEQMAAYERYLRQGVRELVASA